VSRMYEALSAAETKVVKSKIPYEIIEREPIAGDPPNGLNVPYPDTMVSTERADHRPSITEAADKSPHSVRTYLTLGFAALALVVLGVGHALRAGHSGLGGSAQPYGASFEGTIRPASEIRITAESLGTVSKIYVKVGDTVQKGQPLLRMDDREARLALEHAALSRNAAENSLKKFRAPLADMNARVTLSQRQEQQVPTRQWRDSPERAQATYDEAAANHTRAKELFQAGLISKQEMDLRDTELRIAQDDLANAKTLASASERARKDQTEQAELQAKASRQDLEEQLRELELRYQEAQQRVDATEVRATETGVVAEVPVRLGDRVPEGSLLARLAQLNQMVAEVPVAANMISQLQVGQLATIQLPSSPSQQVEGTIRMISPLPSANMTHLIEVEFKNPTRLLLAGQPTEVRFVRP
jgi:membrane fusion protein, heavy metal efflux system